MPTELKDPLFPRLLCETGRKLILHFVLKLNLPIFVTRRLTSSSPCEASIIELCFQIVKEFFLGGLSLVRSRKQVIFVEVFIVVVKWTDNVIFCI